MFYHLHYVPVLKWRQCEYQSLLKLTATIKEWVTPLFEIPTEQWDFENGAPAKSLDEHLAKFGKRLTFNQLRKMPLVFITLHGSLSLHVKKGQSPYRSLAWGGQLLTPTQ